MRIPDHPQIQKLLRLTGPLLQSSANEAGGKTPLVREDIEAKFLSEADGCMDGESYGQLASTVLDLTRKEILIVRQGNVLAKDIWETIL